jgi:hypothetical protein
LIKQRIWYLGEGTAYVLISEKDVPIFEQHVAKLTQVGYEKSPDGNIDLFTKRFNQMDTFHHFE